MSQVNFFVQPLVGHRFAVRVVCHWDKACLDFSLPIWIPGSYTRRDFAKNLYGLRVWCEGEAVEVVMRSPSQWSACASHGGVWAIEYEVYAREYSVRGCYLDDVRAMFNPCCACVLVEGLEKSEQTLCWLPDDSRQQWTVHGAVAEDGRFHFDDYQMLIDSPLMMGEAVRTAVFEVAGVTHEIAITGEGDSAWNMPRLVRDVAQVCHEAVAMFGGLPEAVKRYEFLLFLTDSGYGGLEHQCSTMLMASRKSLPFAGETSRGYLQLLGLFSHEYFHTWNVKSMRPPQYRAGYRLDSEQPTEMLWLFEGFTAYFDNLLLRRSGVISADEYVQLLAEDVCRYLQRSGYRWQSLADSSVEAWTKLYNGGENAGNISTSYYVHGSLVAWCIDMFLREYSNDTASLGTLMPLLWRDEVVKTQGLDEAQFVAIASRVLPEQAREHFVRLIRQLVHGYECLPLMEVAKRSGLELQMLPQANLQDMGGDAPPSARATSELGFRLREHQGAFFVRAIVQDSPALQAGVAVEDKVLTINGEVATVESLWRCGFKNQVGATVQITVLRDGLERHYQFLLGKALKLIGYLKVNQQAGSREQARRRQWFNQALEEK